MVKKEDVAKDFSFLRGHEDILAVLLFGSRAKGEWNERSDVDVCIVAPFHPCGTDLLKEVHRNLDVYGKKYDVKIFEDLPPYLKVGVMESNEVVYEKDPYELHEYFYSIRKLWEDQAQRQKLTKEEIAEMF